MPMRIREVSGITILDIEGNIDINSSDIIETVGWLVNTGKLNIILNLENVGLIDYSGLSILSIAYKNVVNHRGKIRFLHVSLPVLELFKIAKLESVFDSYPDEESAINSFHGDDMDKLHLRRKFKRLDIHLKVKYRIMGEKKAKIFEGNVLNIGAAGIYIFSPYTLPINTMLDLEIGMPDSPTTVEAAGRVIYLADKDLQPHFYPGMGVSFVHLTPEKERTIIDFIDKNITHRADSL